MNFDELLSAACELEKERGLSKETIMSAIEEALNTVYGYNKEKTDEEAEIPDSEYSDLGKHIEINRDTGVVELVSNKVVVEEVNDPDSEISLEEIRKIDPDFNLGEVAEFRDPPEELGRIASHNAKQNIVQKLKEAERNMLLATFQGKQWDVINGTIQKIEIKEGADGKEERHIHFELGRVEGIMLPKEQVATEHYKQYDKMKVYVIEVKERAGKGKEPVVYVSRSHPSLVKKLFELEVPEIAEGIVEIKGIAREAGSRTKIAVFSHDSEVEPVGACVGTRGARVESIVEELKGERIDIIKWSPSPAELISSSLSPAKVLRTFVNEAEKSSMVIVADDQLSLAIGKEGQNVRLAAKLTGWKIDIKSESQIKASVEAQLFESGESENVYEGTDEGASFSTSAE